MGLFGGESKFESSVKLIPYSQQAVYNNISDLRNLEKVRDRVPEDKVQDFSFDQDTVSLNVVWVQVLPVDENSSKMKVTVKAELNPFIKSMVEKPLQEGVEKIADALAMVHYE